MAKRIEEYRSQKGPFTSVEGIKGVKGIGDGVQQGIGIGVSLQAFGVGDVYATENQRSVGHKRVNVIALSDA